MTITFQYANLFCCLPCFWFKQESKSNLDLCCVVDFNRWQIYMKILIRIQCQIVSIHTYLTPQFWMISVDCNHSRKSLLQVLSIQKQLFQPLVAPLETFHEASHFLSWSQILVEDISYKDHKLQLLQWGFYRYDKILLYTPLLIFFNWYRTDSVCYRVIC